MWDFASVFMNTDQGIDCLMQHAPRPRKFEASCVYEVVVQALPNVVHAESVSQIPDCIETNTEIIIVSCVRQRRSTLCVAISRNSYGYHAVVPTIRSHAFTSQHTCI